MKIFFLAQNISAKNLRHYCCKAQSHKMSPKVIKKMSKQNSKISIILFPRNIMIKNLYTQDKIPFIK